MPLVSEPSGTIIVCWLASGHSTKEQDEVVLIFDQSETNKSVSQKERYTEFNLQVRPKPRRGGQTKIC